MSLLALAAVTGLVVTQASHVDYTTSVRTEGRLRRIASSVDRADEGELVLNPRVGLRLSAGTLQTVVEYAPHAVVRGQPFTGGGSEVLHAGTVQLALSPDRLTTLRLIEDISWGEFRFTAPGVATPGAPGAPVLPGTPDDGGFSGAPDSGVSGSLAPLEPIRLIRSNARLVLELAPTRRSAFTLAGGYEFSGGVDEPSRLQMPLQQGPFASIIAEHRWSRRDVWSTEVSVREARFDTGTRVSLGHWTAGWRHSVDRNTDLSLGAGVGAGRTSGDERISPEWQLLPHGQLTLTHTFPPQHHAVVGAVSALVVPAVNPFTAVLEQRIGAQASLQWRPMPQLDVGLRASAASRLFVGSIERQQLLVGAVSVTRSLNTWSALEGQLGWSWERGGALESVRRQWLAGVSFVATREGAL